MHRFTVLLVAAAAVVAFCAASQTAYALVEQLTPDQLTARADSILIANVASARAHWTHDGLVPVGQAGQDQGTVVTDVRLRVLEVLKGDLRRTVSLTVPGGTVDGTSIEVTDAPMFVTGHTYVVFLNSGDGVVAWREGSPAVVGDQVPGLGMSLKQLRSRVASKVGHKSHTLTLPTCGQSPGSAVSVEPPAAQRDLSTQLAVSPGSGSICNPFPNSPRPQEEIEPRSETVLWSDDFEAASTSWRTDEINYAYALWDIAPNGGVGNSRCIHSCQWKWSGSQFLQYNPPTAYPNNAYTLVSVGPFNLTGVSSAKLVFDASIPTVGSGDYVGAGMSYDNSSFYGMNYWEWGSAYQTHEVDITSYCGGYAYLGFWFRSDSATVATAPCVDNVRLVDTSAPVSWGPTITSISPASAPSGTYLGTQFWGGPDQSQITISGSGFGTTPGTVQFFYQENKSAIGAVQGAMTPILDWKDDHIVCEVPVGIVDNYSASAGTGPVMVTTAAGVPSNEFTFGVPFAAKGTRWPASRCYYRLNMNAAEGAAVTSAAQTWNSAGTVFQFGYKGPCRTTTQGSGAGTHMPFDTYNDMCFAPLPSPDFDGVIACAWPRANDKTGQIVECDIVFNTNGILWGDGNGGTMDVQTIAVHEMGHWLSLRDLYGEDTDKIMYGFCDAGWVKRTLSAGDLAGIQWAYTGASTDTAKPSTRAKNATVKRGRTAKIYFVVTDPAPSIGVAVATIKVTNSRGRVMKQIRNARVQTNGWMWWSWKCVLKRGKYRVAVTARDIEGHSQAKITRGVLTVK